MIEINWGKPLHYVVAETGDVQKFSTIEQARYWLRKKWPVMDAARDDALIKIDATMECLAPVGAARQAFSAAARSAGFRPADPVQRLDS
ncbi:DUF982 domain-containing protein [Paracoccus caeni]|uniref:DUF982 domain-containing protein n=1 Tax=Paracoccus caeni TaxID=657651 RepID=A0A934VZG7_9RHOB|nr:DUF982 domain-containing protein [Paracoccus caeni]MBK4217022.1 DUF982 domain-containing protein [Paracoccus caeni]